MTRHALVNVTTDGQMGSRAVRQLWIAAVSPACACRERPFRASSPRVILSWLAMFVLEWLGQDILHENRQKVLTAFALDYDGL